MFPLHVSFELLNTLYSAKLQEKGTDRSHTECLQLRDVTSEQWIWQETVLNTSSQ